MTRLLLPPAAERGHDSDCKVGHTYHQVKSHSAEHYSVCGTEVCLHGSLVTTSSPIVTVHRRFPSNNIPYIHYEVSTTSLLLL